MRPAAVVLATLGLAACHPPSTSRVDVALAGEAMGSTWHVKIAAPVTCADEAAKLQPVIAAALDGIEDAMSTYRPQSEISRFNASRSTAPFPCSHALGVVVQEAIAVGEDTGGAYDITVDPLINLWGFDRAGRRETPPTTEEIAAARAHVGLRHLRVDGDSIAKDDPDVTINLSGIAAGYSVDVVAKLLEERGFHDAMVEVTGELVARGTSSSGHAWRIGVKTPNQDAGDLLETVALNDKALTTSGSYQNFFEDGGRHYSHIIDPQTGAPVLTDLVSVTVLADSAMVADGYDTPFILLGEERARAVMAKRGGMEALFIHAPAVAGGAWRVTTTAGFPARERAPSAPR